MKATELITQLKARISELESDRYHVWMRGFQARALGAAPSSNPFPEPPITVGPLSLPAVPILDPGPSRYDVDPTELPE